MQQILQRFLQTWSKMKIVINSWDWNLYDEYTFWNMIKKCTLMFFSLGYNVLWNKVARNWILYTEKNKILYSLGKVIANLWNVMNLMRIGSRDYEVKKNSFRMKSIQAKKETITISFNYSAQTTISEGKMNCTHSTKQNI